MGQKRLTEKVKILVQLPFKDVENLECVIHTHFSPDLHLGKADNVQGTLVYPVIASFTHQELGHELGVRGVEGVDGIENLQSI